MNLSHTTIDFNSRLVCAIKDGIIFEVNSMGETQAIGHTNDRFNELVDIANKYKQLGIKHGYIEEEKTPEQIQQEQLEMMKNMASIIGNLTKEVEELKNGRNGFDKQDRHGDECGQGAVEQCDKTSDALFKPSEDTGAS